MKDKKSRLLKKFFCAFGALFMLLSCTGKKDKNHLSEASSPYLLQHADNPVHWNEWGTTALERAKKENKPLLISVGYAACHWCHVMEEESFMDTAVARVMNDNFVCIKVDREERPDIDQIYQNACQLINGDSGWPLNAFALPDGQPFYAGTYYAKKNWLELLQEVSKTYHTQHEEIVHQASALTKGISDLDVPFLTKNDGKQLPFSKEDYQSFQHNLYNRIDFKHGGMKGEPKFPLPAIWEFLLQYQYLTGDKQALNAVSGTLTNMALGGIYDQVGGGFARYATDSLWRIPHFEKMLYDNAQLMSLYAHAYQVTQNPFFKQVVEETADFVARELTSPEGGFYCSLNAVSNHEEGSFYAWSNLDLQTALGAKDAASYADYYHVTANGNWKGGKNILYATLTPNAFAREGKQSPEDFDHQLSSAKKLLLNARNNRTRPDTDTKILSAWNALMLKGYVDAYLAVGKEEYLSSALRSAAFLENKLVDKHGRLYRNYKDNKPSIPGFLDDYALLSNAYIRLYQATFEKHWLDLARRLADVACTNFYDRNAGLFFYTSSDEDALVVRKMELSDGVIPSSNSVMCDVLFQLGVYFENSDYHNISLGMCQKISAQAREKPEFYTHWCANIGLFAYGIREVAIVGPDALLKNRDLQKNYLPNGIFMGATREENLPLLEGKYAEGSTLIFVCTNKTCKMPLENTAKAIELIH